VWSSDSDNLIRAQGEDFNVEGNSEGDATTEIWLESTAGDMTIYIAGAGGGEITADCDWWNTSDVNQGAPDNNRTPGTVVFTLNERADQVKIKATRIPSGSGITHTMIGSFTDDSAFNPTDGGSEYGYNLVCFASDPNPGPSPVNDRHEIEFTFIKSGYVDYVIAYAGKCEASASGIEI
jgi:hypothetical protein